MTQTDLTDAIIREAEALVKDARENQAEHAKKLEALVMAFRILVE